MKILSFLVFIGLISANVMADDQAPACETTMIGDHCTVCLDEATVTGLADAGYACTGVTDDDGNAVETQVVCTHDDNDTVALDAAACPVDADAGSES